MLYQILYIIWGASRELSKSKRLNTVVACEQCGTEQPRGTKFCRKCGSKSLLAARDFDNLQSRQRDEEIKDLEQRQRRNLAIQRIKALSGYTFCARCGVHFEDASAFCTQCGADVSKQFMPDQLIFQLVSTEFPKIVRTRQDYQVLQSSSPERGVTRRSLSLAAMKVIDQANAPIFSTTNFLILFAIVTVIGLFIYFTQHAADSDARYTDEAALPAAVPRTPAPILLSITPEPSPPAPEIPPPTPEPPQVTPPATAPQFATAADAQKVAVQRYPDLGIAGSKLNTKFIARYKLYQQTRPDYFRDTSWPLHLAEELTETPQPK